jgi:molybdopterin synthase catalytic subunit
MLKSGEELLAEKIETGVYPKSQIDFSLVYRQFVLNLESNTGSVLSFLGVARLESADGTKKIKSLLIESYERHANEVLRKICQQTRKKYSLTEILIVHGLGTFSAGEPVVSVLVASPRRKQGFQALREAVERYKKEPALFKKEVYKDGTSAWIV